MTTAVTNGTRLLEMRQRRILQVQVTVMADLYVHGSDPCSDQEGTRLSLPYAGRTVHSFEETPMIIMRDCERPARSLSRS